MTNLEKLCLTLVIVRDVVREAKDVSERLLFKGKCKKVGSVTRVGDTYQDRKNINLKIFIHIYFCLF